MNFKDNKAIYLQIADRIGDDVLSGKLAVEAKIPSVREMAAQIEVNANTVARTYEYLQQSGIIYTKRGLGYYVAPDARDTIVRMRREQLMQGEMDYFLGQLKAVGISPADLAKLYQAYLEK
ncbi:MAG: GntR family transcriptional regulator [Muribaculaceae bacterium]|nr:GntR family transcriptional regulator [Muribaculaceae bacterium]MBR1725951.1 GntR family transcriptional regulator [Muribaculaceae bacterium]